jgi:hypothetical protein
MQRGDRVTEDSQLDAPIASVGTRSAAEQETVLRWDDEDQEIRAWTACRAVARAWFRANWPVTVDGTIKGRPCSWESRVPAKAVSFRNIESLGRRMSEEQRQRNAEVLRQARARREAKDREDGS